MICVNLHLGQKRGKSFNTVSIPDLSFCLVPKEPTKPAIHFTGSYFVYLMYSDSVVMSLHVSWTAVGIAALTALVTVLVSAWVPARRAAGIPPIEAVRQAKDIRKPSKQTRFSRRNGSARSRFSYRLFGLPAMVAGRHFAREKRQYRVTIFFAVYQYCAFYLCQLLFFVYPEKCV